MELQAQGTRRRSGALPKTSNGKSPSPARARDRRWFGKIAFSLSRRCKQVVKVNHRRQRNNGPTKEDKLAEDLVVKELPAAPGEDREEDEDPAEAVGEAVGEAEDEVADEAVHFRNLHSKYSALTARPEIPSGKKLRRSQHLINRHTPQTDLHPRHLARTGNTSMHTSAREDSIATRWTAN